MKTTNATDLGYSFGLSLNQAWRAVILGSLILLMVSGCSKLDLVPVTSPPTGVYHQGKFVWYDLLTNDVKNAENFYGNLLGWSFVDRGRYTVIMNKEHAIGGIVEVKSQDGKKHAARWLASLSVPDVDRAVVFLKQAGGVVNEGPVDYVNRGRGALVRDPFGAQLFLLHADGGDPEDAPAALNEWLWVELWSDNSGAAIKFYEKLGGYQAVDWSEDYWLLDNDGWRAGIRLISDKDLEVRWVPVVRVADTLITSKYAEMMGGKVLVEPGKVANNESAALIEDPAGGLFIIQFWPEQPTAAGE